MTTPTEHKFAGTVPQKVGEHVKAKCTCGWVSTVVMEPQYAEASWRLHAQGEQ